MKVDTAHTRAEPNWLLEAKKGCTICNGEDDPRPDWCEACRDSVKLAKRAWRLGAAAQLEECINQVESHLVQVDGVFFDDTTPGLVVAIDALRAQ